MNRRFQCAFVVVIASLVDGCATLVGVEPIGYGRDGDDTPSGVSGDANVGLQDDGGITDGASFLDVVVGSDGKSCDSDGDGFLSPECGGDDCDDTDPRVHPGADFIDDPPPPGRNGDWNCDGIVTTRYQESILCTSLSSSECPLHQGFVTAAACGESAVFQLCYVTQNVCSVKIEGSRKQGCR